MNSFFSRTLALSNLIFIDSIRKHALIGLLALSFSAILAGFFFVNFFGRDIGRAASDYLFSIMWFAGLMVLFFHAVQSMAWDEEKKVIYTFLSRALSRSEYVIGTWLGISVLLIALELILGVSSYGILILIQHSVDPTYFKSLSTSAFILAWCGLTLSLLVILSVIMLFSSMLRGSFPVLLMSLAYYGICSGLPVVIDSLKDNEPHQLLTLLSTIFPDLSRLDFKNFVVPTNSNIEHHIIAWDLFALNGLYIVIALQIACYIYNKRDIY